MLHRLLIHLKNIIFFKFILYSLLATGLAFLFSISKQELSDYLARKEKFQNLLSNVKFKLSLMKNFDHEIPNIEKSYYLLQNTQPANSCNITKPFAEKIKLLSNKFNLPAPKIYNLLSNYNHGEQINSNHDITIAYNIINLSFALKDTSQLQDFLVELDHILPQGAVILEQYINFTEELTPDIISLLRQNNFLGVVNLKIKIMLRDVIYKRKT